MLEGATPQQVAVCDALARLTNQVPINRWCVIGGMMVEFILLERGRSMLRPTTDGDIVGDVLGHEKVLQGLAGGLRSQGFTPLATGWESEFGTRFWNQSTGVYVDLLAPANSGRRRDLTTFARRKALEAPGTDIALATAGPMSVRLPASFEVTLSVPSLGGALYAKMSAYEGLSEHDNRDKHLRDAAQLIAASSLADFTDATPAMLKRLRWLNVAQAGNPWAWEGIDRTDRADAIARLGLLLR